MAENYLLLGALAVPKGKYLDNATADELAILAGHLARHFGNFGRAGVLRPTGILAFLPSALAC